MGRYVQRHYLLIQWIVANQGITHIKKIAGGLLYDILDSEGGFLGYKIF